MLHCVSLSVAGVVERAVALRQGLRRRGRLAPGLALLAVALLPGAAHAQTAVPDNYKQSVVASGLSAPEGVAVDGSGNVYVADASYILQYAPDGSGYTKKNDVAFGLAGPTHLAADANGNVYATGGDGYIFSKYPGDVHIGSVVNSNYHPQGVAVDASGNVYVADTDNNAVHKYAPDGGGYTLATDFGLPRPTWVAVDANGYVYSANQYVYVLTPSGTEYIYRITTSSQGIAADRSGNVYIVDEFSDAVHKYTPKGNGYTQLADIGSGLSNATGVAVDASGNIYISDANGRVLVERPGAVDLGSVAIGSTSASMVVSFRFTGAGTLAATPYKVMTEGVENLDLRAETTQDASACVTGHAYAAGDFCTVRVTLTPRLAGQRRGAVVLYGSSGAPIATSYVYGTGMGPQLAFDPPVQSVVASALNLPYGVAVDGSGNVYIADSFNSAVHKYAPGGSSYTKLADIGSGMNQPYGVAVDGGGNVYVADASNDAVHKYTPDGSGGYAKLADVVNQLSNPFVPFDPYGVAVDGSGNVYVVDTNNNAVRKYTPNGTGYTQLADVASGLSLPTGVAVDGSGNVYISSRGNSAVYKYAPNGSSYSQRTEIGSGLFFLPYGVAVDGSGNVYIADVLQHAIQRYAPDGSGGYAKRADVGSGLYDPFDVAVDGSGNVYIVDTGNNRVLVVNRADAPALSFASTAVGATSSDSPKTVTVENIGNMPLSLPIPSAGLNPSISADFTWNTTGATACPQTSSSSSVAGTLAAGASCTLPISFVPTMAGSISGSLVLTDTALNATNATQSISLSGTATQETPTITTPPTAAAISYGQALSAATLSGGAASTAGSFAWTAPATVPGAGTASYSVTFTPSDTTSYTTATTTVSVTVNKATPTITTPPTAAAITYGQALSAATLSGGAASTAGSFAWTAPTTVPTAGTASYSVSFTPSDSANYNTATGTASVVVNKATPTITLGNLSAIYDGTAHAATATTSPAGLNVAITYDGSPSAPAAAGSYAVVGAIVNDANYTGSATGTLVIDKASLTVAASNATKVYGTANPALSGVVAGQRNGDSFTASYTTTAVASSPVGSYGIVPTVTGTMLGNYTQTLTNGTLTVTQAASAVALAVSSSSITPGQSLTLSATAANASAGSTGTPTGGVSFYDGSTLLGTAALTNGTATFNTSLAAAGVAHVLTAAYAGDANFAGSSTTAGATVTVAQLDFSLALSTPASIRVIPGTSIASSFYLNPLYGSYAGPVSFSVTGLPAGATAVFTPATIAANGGAQTVSLIISTPAAQAQNHTTRSAALAAMLLLPLWGLRRRKGIVRMVCLAMMMLGAAAAVTGCGAGSSFAGQAEQSYNVTVTAASGAIQHAANFTLIVQ